MTATVAVEDLYARVSSVIPPVEWATFTDDIEAMRDTARNNTLLKAAQGG